MYWIGLIFGITTYILLFVTMLLGMRVIQLPFNIIRNWELLLLQQQVYMRLSLLFTFYFTNRRDYAD